MCLTWTCSRASTLRHWTRIQCFAPLTCSRLPGQSLYSATTWRISPVAGRQKWSSHGARSRATSLCCLDTYSMLCSRPFRRAEYGTAPSRASGPHRGFADDLVIVASAAADLSRLLRVMADFCAWSGMRIKREKSVVTGFDFRLYGCYRMRFSCPEKVVQ